MAYVSIRDMRLRPAQVWERLRHEGELVVTSNGRPVAVMASVDNDDPEEALRAFRRARAQAALSRVRAAAAVSGAASWPSDSIDREIFAVRAQRPKV